MTTTALHSQIQHSRFVHHAIAAVAGLFQRSAPASRPAARIQNARDDALRVREMAYAYAQTDPGFAADLYAAAARHEGLASD